MEKKDIEKLNECRNLMIRLCNLPVKEEELKKKFTDEQIKDIRKFYSLFDPEVNRIAQRWREIIDYIEQKEKLK